MRVRIAGLVFGIAAVVVSAFVFLSSDGVEEGQPKDPAVRKQVKTGKTNGKVHKTPPRRNETKLTDVAERAGRPSLFNLDADEEAKLTAAQKELLEQLRTLSDAEDKKGLFKLIARMQKSEEWPDGIPSILHQEAIEALRWIGAEALTELIGYLGCGDESVREEAADALEDMLCDPDKSDYERSSMLKTALPYLNMVTDVEMLDDIFSDIMEMRNSVKASTLIYLLENGSASVKEALVDTIEMVTGEEGYDSPEKIKEWAALEENQDDEDDDEFYGNKSGEDDENDDPDVENSADYQ